MVASIEEDDENKDDETSNHEDTRWTLNEAWRWQADDATGGLYDTAESLDYDEEERLCEVHNQEMREMKLWNADAIERSSTAERRRMSRACKKKDKRDQMAVQAIGLEEVPVHGPYPNDHKKKGRRRHRQGH